MSENEFSRVISFHELGAKAKHHKIEAATDELMSIAERLGLDGLSDLKADIVLENKAGEKGISLTGEITAKGEQACIISYKPVSFSLTEQLNMRFLDADLITPEMEEENFYTLDSEDLEELPDDGQLDLGELVVQYFALSLDPYPRHDDANIDDIQGQHVSVNQPLEEKPNPFDKLKALRDKS